MSIAAKLLRIDAAKDNIKAAIEAKGVTVQPTDTFENDYATRIGEIVTGGGTPSGFQVRFIDYDGTIIDTQYVTSGNDATPPPAPTHAGLTFDGWNNVFTNITKEEDIGATYYPTDGKTRAYITLNTAIGLTVNVFIRKSDAQTITVDWGDGSQNTSSSSGSVTLNHVYATTGDYEITLFYAGTKGTYELGQGNTTSSFMYTTKNALKKLIVSKDVISLRNSAFYQHYSLQTIILSNLVNNIGYDVFINCDNLKSFIFPTSLVTTNTGIFKYCRGLEIVVICNGLTVINSQLFNLCSSLNEIRMPNSVTTISTQAFNTSGLKKAILSNNLTTMGSSSFGYCGALIEIFIPNSVTALVGGFGNCYALKKVVLPAADAVIGDSFFSECYSLFDVTISEGITSALTNAFSYCNSLRIIKFPSTFSSLYTNVFRGTNSILEYDFSSCTSIVTLNSTGIFPVTNNAFIIKVPVALEAAWKAATNWVTYADYIVGV